MMVFETEFRKSKGQPIMYKGYQICLSDYFPINDKGKMIIVIESTNSEYRQGVHLRIDGYFLADGRKVKDIAIWDKRKKFPYVFKYKSKNKKLLVWNIWEGQTHVGVKTIEAKHNGAAMIVEEFSNGCRYRCNDGDPDDDFDDLIFRIERVEE